VDEGRHVTGAQLNVSAPKKKGSHPQIFEAPDFRPLWGTRSKGGGGRKWRKSNREEQNLRRNERFRVFSNLNMVRKCKETKKADTHLQLTWGGARKG